MSTGLFNSRRTGPYFLKKKYAGAARATPLQAGAQKSIETRRALERVKLDSLTDALAEGFDTPKAAAARTGMPLRTVSRLLRKMREGLGWQAQ